MRVVITEESHNRVVWEVHTSLIRIEIGVLIGLALATVPLLLSGSPARGLLLVGVWGLGLAVALYLALAEPVAELGMMERPPEGGLVRRERRWLLRRAPQVWEIPLDDVSGFAVELHTFEQSSGHLYPLARLWGLQATGETFLLSDWFRPQAIQELGASLARAARRPLNPESV